jgi:predicted anti-sigma-YlaC factor YlaD
MSTNDCSIMQPLLGAYLDGELESEAAARLDAHLEACEGCRGTLGDIAETDRILRADPIPMPTATEWAGVEWRLLSRARSTFAARLVKTCALAGAAVVLLGTLVWLVAQVYPSAPTSGGPEGYTAQGEKNAGKDESPLGISVGHGEKF